MRANRYVSYLAAEIEPKAMSTMTAFERAATKTMENIARASTKGSAGTAASALGTNFSRSTEQIVRSGARAETALRRVDKAQHEVGRGAHIMSAGFTRAAAGLQVVQGPLGPLAGRLSALGNILRTMTGFSLAGVLAGGGAFALGGIATQYQRVHDRLAPLYEDQKKLNGALDEVVGIARRTRQALEPVAELYSKITLAGRDAGLTDERSGRIAEIAAKAARLSGGGAATQEAGLTQFSQGFGSGTLSGEEMKSVRENTLRLAKAIADGLGVPMAALKELGAQGRLTPKVIADALEYEAARIEKEFSRMPKRIGTSITEMTNAISIFVGRADESAGATTALANGISFLAGNLDNLVVVIGTVAAAMGGQMFARGAQAVVGWAAAAGQAVMRAKELTGAVAAGNAMVIGSAQALEQRAIFVQRAAQAEVDASTRAVAGAKAYQAQLQAQIPLIEKQIQAQRRALEMARTLDAASRASGGAGRADLVKAATHDLNASQRALMLTQQQLVAVEAELVAANARLATSNVALTGATESLIVAENAAAASSGRLAGAKAVLQGALTKTTALANSLVGFLGGPWGVAFTVAAGAALLLGSRTDYAAEAARRFEGDQAALARQLGFTTDQLYKQSDAARQLAQDLARANILKARSNFQDIAGSAGTTIGNAAFRIHNLPDAIRLQQMRTVLKSGGNLNAEAWKELTEIIKRNPTLADNRGLLQATIGLRVGAKEYADAVREAREVAAELAKPRERPKLGAAVKPPTRAELNRQAAIEAARSPLERARAELAQAKAQGKRGDETDEQYVQRLAGMIQNVNSLAAAHKNAAGGKRADRAAQAALNKAMREAETGRDKADRLAGIMDRYTEDTPIKRLEKLRDEAEKAKRAIDDLVNERVGDKTFTQAEADAKKAEIDAAVDREARRPVADAIREGEEQIQIQTLISKGLGNQAELLERRLGLQKQVGELLPEEEADLARIQRRQLEINEAIEKRTREIERNAEVLDEFRSAGEDAVRSILGGDLIGGIKGAIKRVREAFLDAKANEISVKLFGDPAKNYRDQMTRGLNKSADNLNNSAGNLNTSAGSLQAAADALSAAAGATGDPTAAIGAAGLVPGIGGGAGLLISSMAAVLQQPLADIVNNVGAAGEDIVVIGKRVAQATDEIVVTGQRTKKGEKVLSITETLDKLGTEIGTKIGGPGSVLSKVLGKLGTALEGAQYGTMSSGIFGQLTGVNQSGTGAAIGGALGQVAGAAIGKTVGGVLGSALGPIGGMVGGVLGGTLFGMFGGKKVKSGSATITDLSGNYGIGGNSGSAQRAAMGAASDVTSGLQRILDQLGGTLGAFNVTIGQRHGDWRVNTSGTSLKKKKGAVEFDDDYEAAVRFAIMDAIRDGAIQGIRESTKRLLQAGKDLDAALTKALKFEDVFKRLRRIKDPVGAAVDELNTEFKQLIKIFTEARASAEEWAQLEELYGYERAEAIKNATDQAVSALEAFIQGITSGPESPLSRRTVYENAKKELETFQADIAAGKPVDQDKLITALENFQSASAELYGSREGFYTDFATILQMAQDALANVPTPTDSVLPASPFDTLTPIAQQQLTEQQAGNLILSRIERLLGGDGIVGTAPSTGGTITSLPYYGGGGSYGLYGANLQ